MGHKGLRFGQIVYILVLFITFHFLAFPFFFVPCLLRDSENEEYHVPEQTKNKLKIGQLHDDVILLQLPESFSLLFSCAN